MFQAIGIVIGFTFTLLSIGFIVASVLAGQYEMAWLWLSFGLLSAVFLGAMFLRRKK